MKKLFYIITGVALLVLYGCGASSDFKDVEAVNYGGSLIINNSEDFKSGKGKGLRLDEKNSMVLKDNVNEGEYISPVIETDDFKELVASWNVNTPKETEVEVVFQGRVDGQWSSWFSYGKWSANGTSKSLKNQKDELAGLFIDIFEVLGNKTGDAFRYKILLSRGDTNVESPRVRSISTTLTLKDKIKPAMLEDVNWQVDIDVPQRSQMIIPEIGKIICSPTSVAMILEYYGIYIDTEEAAAGVYDNGAKIYGNWSYNVSYAGAQGVHAYIERFETIDGVKAKIAEGIPVIASIRTNKKNALEGAPQDYPYGHLLVIRGFTIKDGEEYVIVNDPAALETETVRREYKLSEFLETWRNIVYIIVAED